MSNEDSDIKNLPSWKFGDSAEMTDELATLTANGQNSANCFLYRAKALPQNGDRSVVLNSKDSPVCVVEVIDVRLAQFRDVDGSFAIAEGYETLEEWRREHRVFFSKQDLNFDEETLVVCQRFKVVRTFGN